jgi:hypothetical protein
MSQESFHKELEELARIIEKMTATPEGAKQFFNAIANGLISSIKNDPLSQPGAFGSYPDEDARRVPVDTIPRD